MTIFVIDIFQRTDRTDRSGRIALGNPQSVYGYHFIDHGLFSVSGFHMSNKHFIRHQRLYMLLLFCKNMCFLLVFQVIIYHAPDRRIPRTGFGCDNLNCMLAVKHIIDTVSSADFYRVNLTDIKLFNGSCNMCFGQHSLIILVGYKIPDGNQVKMHIRNAAALPFCQIHVFNH